ncbi:MAG TPA: class I lanthipeptide [Chitinophaga sp.]|uniref:class I lanthipeptide n=1 Tax=Chitinophaga sp. TaxID=1869181 RepID=UPI002C42B4B1|nr:class I lanthipeptide [Chitinophaga sp.]HVI47781.1 class I lanthipeptide [Chitinophaga sp.]
MKKKTLNTKLSVKKSIVADLSNEAINQLKGGNNSWAAWECMSRPCSTQLPPIRESIDYCLSKGGNGTC